MKKESKWVSDSEVKEFPNVMIPDDKGYDHSTMFSWALDMVNTELYVVSAEGWYWKTAYLNVFKTEKEALDYLGFKDMEEFYEYNKVVHDSEGFWGYKIEKRTFKGLMEERFKLSFNHLLYEMEKAMVDKTSEEIERFRDYDISYSFYGKGIPQGCGN